MKNAYIGFIKQGVKHENIRIVLNPSHDELNSIFKEMQKQLRANAKNGEKTLIQVYFAGHGHIQDGLTNVLLNSSNPKKVTFNLEARLRTLATIEGSYVIGVLDNCREMLNVTDEVRKIGEATGKTRGVTGAEAKAAPPKLDESRYRNCFITFGCKAGGTVDAQSTLCEIYYNRIQSLSQKNQQGIVILPEDIQRWSARTDKIETLAWAVSRLLLKLPMPPIDEDTIIAS